MHCSNPMIDMRIGDLVVRAYSWHTLEIGMIVGDYTYPPLEEFDEFFVLWGSGNITKELPEEIQHVEDVYHELKSFFDKSCP